MTAGLFHKANHGVRRAASRYWEGKMPVTGFGRCTRTVTTRQCAKIANIQAAGQYEG